MRLTSLLCVILATACSRAPPTASTTTSTPIGQAATPAPWFICDGVDAPKLLVLTRDAAGANVAIATYDKTTGAIVSRESYALGPSEGAAGSVYTPLRQNNADAGAVRALNPGMLDAPGVAYTQPYSSVTLGDLRISCRWMARTRLIGFTGRRSFVVYEDDDGDLIYTTFNFADVAAQRVVDLSKGQHTTTFSLEVRGGQEHVDAGGAAYQFEHNGYVYDISAPWAGAGSIRVTQNGAPVQSEPIIGFEAGAGS